MGLHSVFVPLISVVSANMLIPSLLSFSVEGPL